MTSSTAEKSVQTVPDDATLPPLALCSQTMTPGFLFIFTGMDESDSEALVEIEFHLRPDELMDEDDPASGASSGSEPQHRSESTPKRISANEVKM